MTIFGVAVGNKSVKAKDLADANEVITQLEHEQIPHDVGSNDNGGLPPG